MNMRPTSLRTEFDSSVLVPLDSAAASSPEAVALQSKKGTGVWKSIWNCICWPFRLLYRGFCAFGRWFKERNDNRAKAILAALVILTLGTLFLQIQNIVVAYRAIPLIRDAQNEVAELAGSNSSVIRGGYLESGADYFNIPKRKGVSDTAKTQVAEIEPTYVSASDAVLVFAPLTWGGIWIGLIILWVIGIIYAIFSLREETLGKLGTYIDEKLAKRKKSEPGSVSSTRRRPRGLGMGTQVSVQPTGPVVASVASSEKEPGKFHKVLTQILLVDEVLELLNWVIKFIVNYRKEGTAALRLAR